MKLTWFGQRTLRIHIGGQILVANSDARLPGIERVELESGADRVFGFPDATAEVIDLRGWKPRRQGSMLDEAGDAGVFRTEGAVLVEAIGEPPLVLVDGFVPRMGRWAQDAVVVLFGGEAALRDAGLAVLADHAPRLLMLASEPEAIVAVFEALRAALEDTGLVALEQGMAVEV